MAKLTLEFYDNSEGGLGCHMFDEGKNGEKSFIPLVRAYLEQNLEEFMRPLLGESDRSRLSNTDATH